MLSHTSLRCNFREIAESKKIYIKIALLINLRIIIVVQTPDIKNYPPNEEKILIRFIYGNAIYSTRI